MAINEKDFSEKIDTGLKANKNFNLFLYRFRIGTNSFRKIFDYSNKNWDKKTRTSKAKSDAFNYKEEKKYGSTETDISEDIKLNEFVDQYFKTMEGSTSYSGDKWLGEIQSYYNRYIKKDIGSKKIKDIRQLHVKKIILKIKTL
jgi:hypothetical protein